MYVNARHATFATTLAALSLAVAPTALAAGAPGTHGAPEVHGAAVIIASQTAAAATGQVSHAAHARRGNGQYIAPSQPAQSSQASQPASADGSGWFSSDVAIVAAIIGLGVALIAAATRIRLHGGLRSQ